MGAAEASGLIAELARATRALGLSQQSVLVAVSGGLDSTALLHGLLEIAGASSLKLSIGHVNHGLRGSESEADEKAITEARRLATKVFGPDVNAIRSQEAAAKLFRKIYDASQEDKISSFTG